MAYRMLAPLAGASLLALAVPALAQHHDHQAHQPAQSPHAAHQTSDHSQHQGHATAEAAAEPDHSGHAATTGALGPWSMSREASGTAWQPDTSEHGGVHGQWGAWTTMSHAQLVLAHSAQEGPRGDDMTFLAGMLMASARRDLSDGGIINLRAMVSPDPLMGEEGYPLLLAAGETADGINPIVDRQHPHDALMELSASYARPLSANSSAFVYLGLPGEPAFGPPAFMHRMSAMDSPEAPITHHWLDSTHITFGVVTAGYATGPFKVEASAFRGREPDQHRWDIETPDLDSWSVRANWNPAPEWSLQVSYADVTSPEQLEPDEDETKWTASALHTRRLGEQGWWSTTAAWGRKINEHGEGRDAWLLESAVHPNDAWTLFGRAERTETNELLPGHGHHGEVFTVSKASFGAVRDLRLAEHVRLGVGALYSLNFVPDDLEAEYGGDPDGAMAFIRLKVG